MTTQQLDRNKRGPALVAWRQRGYDAALAGRKPEPPTDPGARSAYMSGHRRGRDARAKL